MDKIKSIYKESGNKRYLTINIESFNYIFNNDFEDTDDIENKVKLALLTIENDFKQKTNYPPFVTRPGSLNSQDIILATEANKSILKVRNTDVIFTFLKKFKTRIINISLFLILKNIGKNIIKLFLFLNLSIKLDNLVMKLNTIQY